MAKSIPVEKHSTGTKGGARPGAGRKKGEPNKKTAALQAAVEASGLTPLEYMLQVLRDDRNEMPVRLDAAKSAAPYVHAKLANVQVTGKDGGPVQVESFRLVPLTSAS